MDEEDLYDDEAQLEEVTVSAQRESTPDGKRVAAEFVNDYRSGAKDYEEQLGTAKAKRLAAIEASKAQLIAARERLMAQKRSKAELLFAISAGFGSPTKTGTFGEQMGNVSRSIAPEVKAAREWRDARDDKALGYDQSISALDAGAADIELKLLQMRRKQEADLAGRAMTVLARPDPRAPAGARPRVPATHDGINPATGKPETYTIDENGVIRWLGITPTTSTKRSLPTHAVNDLLQKGTAAQDFSRLYDTFKDGYGGYVVNTMGDVDNFVKRNITGDDTGQAQWWQDYQMQLNLTRKELFGSALTVPEKAEFEKAMVRPGMRDDEIRKNLARQKRAALNAARKLARAYKAGKYDDEQIEGALGFTLNELDDALADPNAPAAPAPAAGGLPSKEAIAAERARRAAAKAKP